MTECQVCNSRLVTAGLSPGQQIRCANCQSLSRFGKVEKVATDRLAWRSFWFGISSILLLTITGIPAMYYGVRSLLRMRFFRPKWRDRAAAIVGTLLGGCFGIFIGFIVVCIIIINMIRVFTSQETTVPAEVAQRCSQFFEFSYPRVTPVKARSELNSQYLFDYSDHPETEEEKRKILIRLAFIRSSLQPNDAVITQQLRKKRLGKTKFGTNHESEYLDWTFDGIPINVKKSVFSRTINPDSDSTSLEETHRHYWGYIKGNNGLYGMAVLFEPGSFDLSDEEVQHIFSSTQMK